MQHNRFHVYLFSRVRPQSKSAAYNNISLMCCKSLISSSLPIAIIYLVYTRQFNLASGAVHVKKNKCRSDLAMTKLTTVSHQKRPSFHRNCLSPPNFPKVLTWYICRVALMCVVYAFTTIPSLIFAEIGETIQRGDIGEMMRKKRVVRPEGPNACYVLKFFTFCICIRTESRKAEIRTL